MGRVLDALGQGREGGLFLLDVFEQVFSAGVEGGDLGVELVELFLVRLLSTGR